MDIKQKYISCDSRLKLLVGKDGDDWIVGFENSEWHTHGDLLVPEYGDSPAIAAEHFIKAILEDREIIAISEFPNKPSIISITDDPESERKHKLPEETLTIRTWSGKKG
jgi:hypothetical protein